MIWEVGDKIKKWLIDEKLFIKEIGNSKSNFNFIIINPIKKTKTINIWQPKGRNDLVIITIEVKVRDNHKQQISGLLEEERLEFLLDIKRAFIKQRLNYKLIKKDEILQGFIIRRKIYEDGLSKDRLMNEINNVGFGAFYGITMIQKEFGIPTKEISDSIEEIPDERVYYTDLIVPPESLIYPLKE